MVDPIQTLNKCFLRNFFRIKTYILRNWFVSELSILTIIVISKSTFCQGGGIDGTSVSKLTYVPKEGEKGQTVKPTNNFEEKHFIVFSAKILYKIIQYNF